MSIDTGNLLEPRQERKPGDFYRNHMGAPYVSHPTDLKKDGTPKRVVYGRPSSFGSALDNAFSLIKWKERQLLVGAGIVDPDWSQFTDRDQLDRLAARCHEAAGSSLAADRGTHIHRILEEYDRNGAYAWQWLGAEGELLGLPAVLQARIVEQWRAFRAELGVTALAIEATVVHDGWRLAGTLDRLDVADRNILTGLGVIPAGCAFIGDIKTGSLTLGRDGQPNYWVKYPVQLAAYAWGVPYNTDTDERGSWGYCEACVAKDEWCPHLVPNPDIALIYHYDLAQALNGEPTDWQAIPVNLEAGREGGDLCRLAADFGKRRDLFLMPAPTIAPVSNPAGVEPTTGPAPATSGPVVDDFHIVVSDGRRGSVTVPTSRTWIHAKVRELAANGHEQVIRQQWPQGVPPLTDTSQTVEQLTQLFHMVRRVETEVSAPFDPEPKIAAAEVSCPTPSAAAPLDDGAFLDPHEIELLKARMLALPDTRHIQLADISREANAAGRPISVTAKPCVRRWEIARALVLWAESDLPLDDLFRFVVMYSSVEQIRQIDTLGGVLSLFTIDQAVALADVFDRVGDPNN